MQASIHDVIKYLLETRIAQKTIMVEWTGRQSRHTKGTPASQEENTNRPGRDCSQPETTGYGAHVLPFFHTLVTYRGARDNMGNTLPIMLLHTILYILENLSNLVNP